MGGATGTGEFLHELEEKMEVCWLHFGIFFLFFFFDYVEKKTAECGKKSRRKG
jgi:hypothetical protein